LTVRDVDRNHYHALAHVRIHVHELLADFDCDYTEAASDFVDWDCG